VNLSVISNLAEALAVIFAVVFGVIQVRQLRTHRRRDSTLALMQSLQTKDMLASPLVLDSLPEGLSRGELQERPGEEFISVQILLGTWESLGILVFRREVGLDLVDDFYSGTILHSWNKLRRFVEEVRAETGRETRWEWFQWLSERMIERESTKSPIPAHVQHRNWHPKSS
jgi:hypothetical protein